MTVTKLDSNAALFEDWDQLASCWAIFSQDHREKVSAANCPLYSNTKSHRSDMLALEPGTMAADATLSVSIPRTQSIWPYIYKNSAEC